ncbi:MAG: TonB-dependent receptor, partial [Candidatus Sulfotelmatobacter sp.]
GAGLPGNFIQGFGSPSDTFHNIQIGAFWQDSWKVRRNLTLNYGVRYDVEVPPTFKPITPLGQAGYNYLGLQKGIQTETHHFQPRVGLAWDPKGDGKTVVRTSYGIFYDHPLLALYFLGDASDGSSSGQLAFPGTGTCAGAGNPANLNAIPVFQGLINRPGCAPGPAALIPALGYLPNQQQFTSLNFPNSLFLNQNYITDGFPLFFQPFGYPQSKNFVFAYSQQANLTIERDLGQGFAFSLAYNFNGGRHLNHPINANAQRGDLLVANFLAAQSDPTSYASIGGPLGVGSGPSSQGFRPCGVNPSGQPWVSAALTSFFRPSGLNPSIANALTAAGAGACLQEFPGVLKFFQASGYNVADINTSCNPATLANCIPFGDMDANYSNGSSVYHGLSANLRKRFGNHYEFLASYTWSHAIDDSTDLQSTTTPQDSFYPSLDRSNSLFDQRQRFVFSGVYQSGKLGGDGFASKLFSNWTVAPLVEFDSGRPFNIITGNGDNLQESSLTGRPNTFVNPGCTALGFPSVASKFSPTGVLQEPCLADFNGTLLSLDGNLGRNAGLTPWNVFDDLRIAKRIYFGERFNMELIADM